MGPSDDTAKSLLNSKKIITSNGPPLTQDLIGVYPERSVVTPE